MHRCYFHFRYFKRHDNGFGQILVFSYIVIVYINLASNRVKVICRLLIYKQAHNRLKSVPCFTIVYLNWFNISVWVHFLLYASSLWILAFVVYIFRTSPWFFFSTFKCKHNLKQLSELRISLVTQRPTP